MKKTQLLTILFLVILNSAAGQSQRGRQLDARRTQQQVKVDGLLNEAAWKDAAPMKDLVEFRPRIGVPEEEGVRTEAWLMYNDQGIFFGGYCYERTRDSIAVELQGRDGFGTNDYIGIIFDTYQDKLNGFEYFVTPLNEQWDAKMAPAGSSDNGGEDFSWNAVWKSGAVIHDDGWSFEFFIPFSAIRFGNKSVQDWGINITRRRRKTEQQYTWNPIDPNVNGFLTQEGNWTGIRDIKPPIRLQFSPYFSVYANHFPENAAGQRNWNNQVNGGLDVKYGINQAFTLDATLIPDFGQVQSDNQVLNLSPFEVRFNENRSFFTEGTELFSKGNLFYSRRIGGKPLYLYQVGDQLKPTEQIISNPSESKLINASKISGRTQQGLGIGFLNAVTRAQHAVVEDAATGEKRLVETDPLTNYNILVLDQTLKNNSSISLVNTNVLRNGHEYDANVTAALFDFNDKKNTWNVGGKLALSQLFNYETDGSTKQGYHQSLYLGKISGRFNFNVWHELTDTKYSHNDLGYFTNNNYVNHGLYMGYRWTTPRAWYNRINVNLNASVSQLFNKIALLEPRYQESNFNVNANVQTKKLSWMGVFLGIAPRSNDFYEPRRYGYFFKRGASVVAESWFESNEARRYFIGASVTVRKYFNFYNGLAADMSLSQRYRFNQRLTVSHQIALQPRNNTMGFALMEGDDILFGRRKIITIENVLSLKYSFNNRMGITFRARHYMSDVTNRAYYLLDKNSGRLELAPAFGGTADRNANYFNIDMVYTWQFAPGSFINLVWKNGVYADRPDPESNYFRNFRHTWQSDQNNNLSLKLIYFLDTQQWLAHKKRKRS